MTTSDTRFRVEPGSFRDPANRVFHAGDEVLRGLGPQAAADWRALHAADFFTALLAGTSNRAAATEFAFLVGIPTMYAATGYELLKVLKSGGAAHEDWSALIVGFVVSAVVAFAAVKWLLGYIRSHRFTPFSVYRILLGVALLLWLPTGG